MTIKIAVLDDWQGVARTSADWTALAARAEISFFEDALPDEDAAAARLADFDVVMSMRERTPFPASLIARLPKLRLLSVTGARNKSVDLKALAERGIVATRTEAGEDGSATAELALLLMLEGSRRVAAGDANIRAGRFQDGIAPGFTLSGKTLGLIGLGRLGSLMARYAKALGMSVLAWSPNLTPERAEAGGADYAAKDDLLAKADVISLHMVLAPATRGIIGARDIALLKPGAVIVNSSRGPLIDEAALLAALHAGKVVAALDVYDREPLPVDHPLRSMPNTVLSPHLGYCVQENFAVFYRQSIENVLAFLDGKTLRPLTDGA
ncbi:D-2-hydroxyacid dehydrogenase family protein [Bosea caraganae]|uniref:D-2-hydroxyacid dehydrogenase family protein n=1 Tax=Bosea caraganae TaxID=2763117 RepID=A0A370LAL2_9HYPH|nr:D-2-hydroxyacid dehydrogenase family protein [Bosea caraganae]RDJ21710.1 D-2-hydroxyacid dehydrogenase family protein [Bosea caraganae]RDJ28259.1 D-2-hydroxyacid dehydrogenase family protein [Bosea caraganae]